MGISLDETAPLLAEFGVTGIEGQSVGGSVPESGALYLQLATGAPITGTIYSVPGRLDVYDANASPAEPTTQGVALEPLLSSVLPAVLADHRSRVGASDEDNPYFAMRVMADPNDPLAGIVLDYTSLDGAALRYSLEGEYLGPVQ